MRDDTDQEERENTCGKCRVSQARGTELQELSDAMFRSLMFKDEHGKGVREQVLRGLFRSKWETAA
jgi:hypothetical protein